MAKKNQTHLPNMPDRNPEAAYVQPVRSVTQLSNGRYDAQRYEQKPIEQACTALAAYETNYGLLSTLHVSIAVLVQEVFPQLRDSDRSTAQAGTMRKREELLETFFGSHLQLNALASNQVVSEALAKQRADALHVLSLFEAVSETKDVASKYVTKLRGVATPASEQVA